MSVRATLLVWALERHSRAQSGGPQYTHRLVWAGLTGASPRKGHRDDQGIGASVVRGEMERAERAQLGEQRAQGDLIHVSGYPMGGYEEKREALGSGARGQDKRQQALTETHKIPVNRRKCFLP